MGPNKKQLPDGRVKFCYNGIQMIKSKSNVIKCDRKLVEMETNDVNTAEECQNTGTNPLSIENSNIDNSISQKSPSTFNEKKRYRSDRTIKKCYYCWKFFTIKDFKSHMIATHGRVDNFERIEKNLPKKEIEKNLPKKEIEKQKCHYCEMFFPKKELNSHISAMHTLRKCPYCGKFIPTKDLKSHIVAMHRKEHFSTIEKNLEKKKLEEQKCDYCEKNFAKTELKIHISAMHTCNVCMKYFKETEDLKKHIFNGHKEIVKTV